MRNEIILKGLVIFSLLYSTIIILFSYGAMNFKGDLFHNMGFIDIIFGIIQAVLFYLFLSWPWIACYNSSRLESNAPRIIAFILITFTYSSIVFIGKSYSTDNANNYLFVIFSWVLYPVTLLFSRKNKAI